MKVHKKQFGREIKYQLLGWVLFIFCAIFFILSSLKNHDILTFIGSAIFLIACIVFLIPLLMPKTKKGLNNYERNEKKRQTDWNR